MTTYRLLYLVGQLGSGGLERQLVSFLQALDRKRYRPVVCVWNFKEGDAFVPPLRALNVPIYAVPRSLSALGKLQYFRRLVREVRPELVHSYSFYTNFSAYWGTWGRRTIAIGALQSDFTTEKHLAGCVLGRLSARWPRYQISNNFAGARAATSSKSIFAPKYLSVVRNGLDSEFFNVAPAPRNGRISFVGIGSLQPDKRWDRLVHVVHELKNRGYEFKAQIVGDGPLRQDLQQLAHGLGVAEQVRFTGYTDNVQATLRNADFLVHTSDREGCPNAILEAMACGRAVVATDAGDIPVLVDEGMTGFVVRRGDDRSLAERIATLLKNPSVCHRMGLAGRAKAQKEFGIGQLVSGTLKAYKRAGWKD
jgi:glycosyltransferase involved in cell wall biosynthesis